MADSVPEPGEGERRTVVWFSAGAPSAVAAKLMLAKGPCVIAYTDPGSEHPDNERFIKDCEAWFGQEVVRLRSDKYTDTWDVWERTRFLVGPGGARCTGELKKGVRHAFERPDDIQVFGYTYDEKHRVTRLQDSEPTLNLSFPLIEAGLTKADCLAMVERAGIELPAMYRLGFKNANCIGCCKASGFGYWNRIRRHFPDVFDRMAKLERDIGHSICSEEVTEGSREKTPVWLDELDPERGDYESENSPECSLLCVIAESSFDV